MRPVTNISQVRSQSRNTPLDGSLRASLLMEIGLYLAILIISFRTMYLSLFRVVTRHEPGSEVGTSIP